MDCGFLCFLVAWVSGIGWLGACMVGYRGFLGCVLCLDLGFLLGLCDCLVWCCGEHFLGFWLYVAYLWDLRPGFCFCRFDTGFDYLIGSVVGGLWFLVFVDC